RLLAAHLLVEQGRPGQAGPARRAGAAALRGLAGASLDGLRLRGGGGSLPGARRTGHRSGRAGPVQRPHRFHVRFLHPGRGCRVRVPAVLAPGPRCRDDHPGHAVPVTARGRAGLAGPARRGAETARTLLTPGRRGGRGRMKVVLRQDVKKLGKAGEVVNVADGYARNYLIPRGLAVEARDRNLSMLREHQRQADRKAAQALEQARRDAAKIEGKVVSLAVRAGEGGRLYGSVTNADVAAALQ